MKDEEMAEEYVDTILNKDDAELDKYLDENLGDLKLTKKQAGILLGIIKGVGICSYLAGLKAGRPQWHKVKDELPTNTGLYLIFYYNSFFNDKVRCIARYSPDRKEFLNLNIGDGDEVIAWCEIPTFDKE